VRCAPWNLDERLLLIGDAAHAIVPFHGQGMNCALEDCRLLDELLAEGGACPFARFAAARRPDTDAIAAMSLENYVEMRDSVLDPQHQLHRQLELELERRFPGRFIPRYAMVMFHDEIPYSTALARGRIQQQILDALTAALPLGGVAGDVDWSLAATMIQDQLPQLEASPHA
jgi:kynurenine 3-monooxygenase